MPICEKQYRKTAVWAGIVCIGLGILLLFTSEKPFLGFGFIIAGIFSFGGLYHLRDISKPKNEVLREGKSETFS